MFCSFGQRPYQTCLKRACVPRLLVSLYQLFDLCLIKHVLTVWPLTSTLACLVTKQCLKVFGRQTFMVCPGPYSNVNKKFSQTDKYRVFSTLILTEPPSKLRNWCRWKKILSLKIPILDFHEQNTVFHLSSICCKHRNRCYNYRRHSTTKIKVFAEKQMPICDFSWTK